MSAEPSHKPMISLIAAMARNRVIGIDNRLPWKLSADLQYFKRVTMGKPIVMGRRTYESIGRPLPGRTNVIVTNDPSFRAEGCIVVHSVEEALAAAGDVAEVMVIGGASFYRQMLPYADRLYLTVIHRDFEGDAWFPEIDPQQWIESKRDDHDADDRNPYGYSFIEYRRKR